MLVHCNLATNDYQQASKVLFSFVPNKSFGQLLNISPHSPIMLRTVNSIFDEIKVWFTDQDNNDLEIEDNVNITLAVGLNKPKSRKYVQGQGFMSLANKMFDVGKKVATSKATKDFAKTAGKKVVHKSAEAIGDLIGSKIADKIISAGQKKHAITENERQIDETNDIFIPPGKPAQIIKDLKLFST